MKDLHSDKRNEIRKACLIIQLFLLMPVFASAQHFKVIQTSDGLPNNTVKAIAQDKNGFVWIGTFDGLCRFDGKNFSVFKHHPEDSLSIANNHISAIQPVRNGLWVGTNKGLNFFSFDKNCFYPGNQLLPTGKTAPITGPIVHITTVQKTIYALTATGELYALRNGLLWERCVYAPEMRWISIAEYKNKALLAYSSNGIYLLDPKSKRIISQYLYKTTGEGIIYYSKNQDVVYIAYGLGSTTDAFKIDHNLRFKKVSPSVPSGVKSIVDYKDNTVFATDGNGLNYLKGNDIKAVTPQNSTLSSDAIFSLFVDRDSNLWAGTHRGGLNIYSDRNDRFTSLTMGKKQLTHNMVSALLIRNNLLYIGLDGGGLNIYNLVTKETRAFTTANSAIPGNNILSLSDDGKYIWLGIYGKGICRYSPHDHSFKSYSLPLAEKHTNNLWRLCDAGNGYIWILGNVCYAFNKEKEEFIYIDALKDVPVSHIVQDGNNVWVSSAGKGLFKLDRETFNLKAHYYKDSPHTPITSNTVQYFFIDSKQQIWFSTAQSGLYKLEEKTGTITSYSTPNTWVDLNISAIQEEGNHLWISTSNGLFRFNTLTRAFVYFGEEDNIPSAHFNYQACAKQHGIFYFGTTKGVVSFSSGAIGKEKQAKTVCFTELELISNEKKTISLYSDHPKEIRLPYNQNFFTIRFSVPEYIASEKIHFSYYMKNFEKEWRDISKNRSATYTNIPPGEYVFYVKSSDGEGGWNETPSCIRIVIMKPWWTTYWALCIYVMIASGILFVIFWFYRHTLNIKHTLQLKEIEKNTAKSIHEAKLNFFAQITHELRTPIFLITAPLEELLSSGKYPVTLSKSGLSAMYRNAMRLNKLISRIIDFRKIESGKLKLEKQRLNVVSFCKSLITDYEALCLQKEIVFLYHPAKTIIQLNCDPEKLEMILSNLVSNAFKYTPEGGKVTLSIDETDAFVVFTVQDNGVGIKKEHHEMIFDTFFQINTSGTSRTGDGIGLSFVKHLVELHGGQIRVESEEGKGSDFVLYFPKNNDEKGEIEVEESVIMESNTRKESSTIQSPANVCTVLIIDDEQETVDLLEHSLSQDFKIVKAHNGIDGLSLAQDALPDIIICDLMMPKMDGMEFLSHIKSDKKTAHIPVLMLTAKTFEEDKIAAFDLGADAYLTKPISLKYLRKRIDHLLAQQDFSQKAQLPTLGEKGYSKEEQRFLWRCREVIDDNLANADFSIAFFTEQLGMSHSAAYKRIKQITGLSILDFITEYKVFKAVQSFKEGETNINNVAAQCGFKDTKSFRDAFKRKMKMLPTHYVKQL